MTDPLIPVSPPRHALDQLLAVIVKDLRSLPLAWADTDVDDRNALISKWRAVLAAGPQEADK